ncbi:PAQR family membrane homeostasis protein TrhA [Zooshikella harenae]|uniref:Hemolysin III family protein n=1 Tax=Zooshikella harenae TaxID=2827238 RepID=A0ABS5ZIH8_9GAMM|nr:hemolysin III family protein [Zooshikella harenae]MBU2713055.1 hemolysin III family protein [Zooshikella harenae]
MYKGERFNSITHLIGACAALYGLIVLILIAADEGDPWKIVSFSIYGSTLFLLYLVSTLYHSTSGRLKKILRKVDHSSIYLLIAGTYTPFTLITLRGPWGWALFGIVWALAILGIIIDLWPQKGERILPIIIYLVMGWLAIIALDPLLTNLSTSGFIWLLVGGLLYTTGILFYAFDERIKHFHGIWHCFVLGGSIAHYCTVLIYVA